MELILKTLAVICVMVAALLYFISIQGIKSSVPDDKREYMDPLPSMLKKIWPLVLTFSYFIGEMMPVDQLEKHNKKLKQSGLIYLMTPEQFVGLRVVSAILWSLIVIILMLLLER